MKSSVKCFEKFILCDGLDARSGCSATTGFASSVPFVCHVLNVHIKGSTTTRSAASVPYRRMGVFHNVFENVGPMVDGTVGHPPPCFTSGWTNDHLVLLTTSQIRSSVAGQYMYNHRGGP